MCSSACWRTGGRSARWTARRNGGIRRRVGACCGGLGPGWHDWALPVIHQHLGSAVNEAGIREHPPLIRFPKSLEDLLSRWTIITLLTIGGTVFVASLVLFLVFLVNAGDSKWIVLALSLIGIVGSLLSLTVTGRLVSTRSTYLREADWFAEDLRAAIAAINRSSGTRRESLVEAARSAVGKANILVEYLIDAQEADLARSVRNGGP
jgi:hypothetical protein